MRLHRPIDALHFLHQLLVDVQPPGRIDDQRVVDAAARLLPAAARAIAGGLLPRRARKEIGADALGDALQLQDRRRAAHIGADQQHPAALTLLEPARELAGGGGLARALQPGEQHHLRRLNVERKAGLRLTQQCDQLAMQDADQAWPGVRLVATSAPSARSLTPIDEALDDRQGDVGLEQRDAHFAQRLGDILFGHAAAAAHELHRAAEALGQFVEHVGLTNRSIQLIRQAIIRGRWTRRPRRC